MDLNSFRKGVKEDWFASSSAFQKHVMYGKLDTGDLADSQSLRAACVYMHFGWLRTWKCSKCKASTVLQQGRSLTEILWVCSRNHSHKHFRKSAEVPALPFLRTGSWMSFLHFLVMMKNNMKIKTIEEELHGAHEVSHQRIFVWQQKYHDAIRAYVDAKATYRIGGPGAHVVVDESGIGKVGWMVGKQAVKAGRIMKKPARIVARKPCKTVWHPAAKPHPKKKAGTALDKRKSTRWLWVGVECGKKQVKTHGKGTKRVALEILPHPEAAPSKKPRGKTSLKNVIGKHIKSRSTVVSDGWLSTQKAAEELNLSSSACNHAKGFRDLATGVHSKDAESEISRFKLWCRSKWSKVRTVNLKDQLRKKQKLDGKVAEYMLQTNVGDAMKVPMGVLLEAFAIASKSCNWKPVLL
ncbi:unnamed protein product [Symbiodinium sp. CCMP2592]|nr:unnamed protein product [Symbiodinium sp. CCMP2592]